MTMAHANDSSADTSTHADRSAIGPREQATPAIALSFGLINRRPHRFEPAGAQGGKPQWSMMADGSDGLDGDGLSARVKSRQKVNDPISRSDYECCALANPGQPAQSPPMSQTVFQEIKDSLQKLYLEDSRPWLVGFSGGKDSTLLAALVFDTA